MNFSHRRTQLAAAGVALVALGGLGSALAVTVGSSGHHAGQVAVVTRSADQTPDTTVPDATTTTPAAPADTATTEAPAPADTTSPAPSSDETTPTVETPAPESTTPATDAPTVTVAPGDTPATTDAPSYVTTTLDVSCTSWDGNDQTECTLTIVPADHSTVCTGPIGIGSPGFVNIAPNTYRGLANVSDLSPTKAVTDDSPIGAGPYLLASYLGGLGCGGSQTDYTMPRP